jgi:hypothetical protein
VGAASSVVLSCRSYILAYNSHALKDIFNVHTLDLQVRPQQQLTVPCQDCLNSLSGLLELVAFGQGPVYAWMGLGGSEMSHIAAHVGAGAHSGALTPSLPLLVCCCLLCCCRQAVAKSFGFSGPPKVSLNIESKAAHGRRAKKVQQGQGGAGGGADYRRFKPASGHAFSASNPYGVRAKGDNRQLARF